MGEKTLREWTYLAASLLALVRRGNFYRDNRVGIQPLEAVGWIRLREQA